MIQTSFKVQTIGEILSAERNKRGLEIKQVSEVTRIRKEYLEALETGNYSIFPSEVYVKGFLKNYAKFLGIDVKRALALYRRENKDIRNANIEKPSGVSKKFDFILTPGKLILAAVIVTFIAIAYYLISQAGTILETPALEITAPVAVAKDGTGEFSTVDGTIDIKGKISAGATLKVNGDEVTTNNLEQFEIRDLTLDIGENEFVLIAESQFGRESRATIVIIRNESDEQDQEVIPTEENSTVDQMDIKIDIGEEDANVLVITDGQTQINRVLSSGETREFTASKTFALQTPRPSAVKITINGEEYSILTSKRHEWTLENGEVTKTK